jgi:hypothetical protein
MCNKRVLESSRRLKGPHRDENPRDKKCDVVGFIANLVAVDDDMYCRILSWALASNMKCLVVRTNSAAEKYKSEGKVLPLPAAR